MTTSRTQGATRPYTKNEHAGFARRYPIKSVSNAPILQAVRERELKLRKG